MALPQVKALGLFAIVLSVTGIGFALFLENSAGKMASVMNFGATGVQTGGGLFIILALLFLYGFFRT